MVSHSKLRLTSSVRLFLSHKTRVIWFEPCFLDTYLVLQKLQILDSFHWSEVVKQRRPMGRTQSIDFFIKKKCLSNTISLEMCCQYYEFSHENVDLQPFWK
jgi:hypothetical protein